MLLYRDRHSSPLACLAFARSNFAKKNKRLLAVYFSWDEPNFNLGRPELHLDRPLGQTSNLGRVEPINWSLETIYGRSIRLKQMERKLKNVLVDPNSYRWTWLSQTSNFSWIYLTTFGSSHEKFDVLPRPNSITHDRTETHNPEIITPILGLYHFVLTDRFIFRYIL